MRESGNEIVEPFVMAAKRPVTARGERTRRALVAAARRLFEANGYVATNIGDISAEALVSHGTFYTYFTSKEEVFAEVVSDLIADFQRIAHDEPAVDRGAALWERIERSNRGYLRAYEANARMMAVLEQVATFNPRLAKTRRQARRYWVDRSAKAIVGWQQQGLVDRHIDPVYAASMLGSMVDRSSYLWVVVGEHYEFGSAVEQLTRLYCGALGLQYGRASAQRAS
ncbi:MAG: TetR/AcrR family transcriptional regulator [Actinomycetota bacterium]